MIGEKIRKIRILKGFSQEYMSDRLKISQPSYSDIENSKTKVSIETIQKLATIFEIDVQDLINFNQNSLFGSTVNQNSSDFFIIQKFINEVYENEKKLYEDQIQNLKNEVDYLRKKIDNIL